MMTKLDKCINNNHALYQAVFYRKNKEYTRNDSIWYSLEKPPPLYSNIVTRSPEWQPDEIFREIDRRFESEGWHEWTIKDSFGVLDLEPYGFTKLFDAQWIYLDWRNFEPVDGETELDYRSINTEAEYVKWLRAWDPDISLGDAIFDPEFIWDMNFVAGFKDDEIICGCFENPSDDVRGISNFFAPEPRTNHWSKIIELLSGIKDVVGYSRNAEEWTPLGFETIGPLTVWIKRK